jgi:enamine deaminase RidA (YjgF/YER057c/UK114 family)
LAKESLGLARRTVTPTGVRRGGFIYTGDQADLNRHGDVVNPGDLSTQTINVLQFVDDILADFGSTLDNLLKLVIYFTGELADEALILDLIASRLEQNHRPLSPLFAYPHCAIQECE